MAQIKEQRINHLKKRSLVFFVIIFILSVLVIAYRGLQSYLQAPYQWTRNGSTYTNAYYGLEITKREQWLRYIEGDSLSKKIFVSQLFENPTPIFFPKGNLIEFHKFGETQQLDAIVFIGAVDELKGKPYGQSVRKYARASLAFLLAPKKIWLEEAHIEVMALNGTHCAKIRASYDLSKMGKMTGEFYFFIRDGKGVNVGYTATPSEFDKYHDEAMSIIQSLRFKDPQSSTYTPLIWNTLGSRDKKEKK